ncbi:MAG: hypothetical protein GTO18_13825, partial [Anaerolineales bacterium]|nr:hypothetical protein [Anaerolineales bacterium]
TVVIAVQSSGVTLDLLLIPVLLLLFLLAVRSGPIFARIPILQRVVEELSSATAQIRVRGALALMVAWVVLAEALGVELILGAFLAGIIAGLLTGPDDANAREKLDAIGYGFFIPIFFIMVGVNFNLTALLESGRALLLLPLLVIIGFAVKVVPGLLYRINFSWREALSSGILQSARLSLIIAASAIALSIGAISEAFNAAIILLAIITVTLAPLIFHWIFPGITEERRLGIIIIGKDQLAEFLAERLSTSGEPLAVICPDESRIEAFQQLGVNIVSRCPDLPDAMTQAGAETARALVDLTSSSEETMEVCRTGREHFDIPLVVSRISDVELIPNLQGMGVKVVQPALATAMALEGALRYPTAFDVLAHQTEQVNVGEVNMTNKSLDGVALRKIRLPGDALILSLHRDQSVVVPDGDVVLQYGDRLGLIGSPDAVEQAMGLLSSQ